jgi:putative membrane protein
MTLFIGLCVAAVALAQSGQNQPSGGQNPDSTDARGQGMGRNQGQGTGSGGGMTGDRATGDGAVHSGSRINAQIDQQFEQDWVKHAYSGNQFEVQLGQLVNDKAQDPQIKRIAQRLVDDHRQANEQLKQVAQQMNVQISEELTPVHQAKLQHYQQKQGNQLELGFLFDQIGHHTKDVLEYQFVAQNAQNPQLKQYAAQCVPKLRDHAQMLMQIAPVGEARTAGERIPPVGGSDRGTRGTGGTGGSGDTTGTGGGRTGDR